MSQPAKQEFRKEKMKKGIKYGESTWSTEGQILKKSIELNSMVFLPLVFLSFYLSIEGKARERGGIERRILTGERVVFIEGG